jgi:hypothetical protein
MYILLKLGEINYMERNTGKRSVGGTRMSRRLSAFSTSFFLLPKKITFVMSKFLVVMNKLKAQ